MEKVVSISNREKNSIVFQKTQYVHESAVAHRELDQILRKWAVMSGFEQDQQRYEDLSLLYR